MRKLDKHTARATARESNGVGAGGVREPDVHALKVPCHERLQAERLQQVAEVVASASEEELVEIEGKVAARRTELRQIKPEL